MHEENKIVEEELKELEGSIGKDWGEFCDKIDHDDYPTKQSFNYPMGHEGLGVMVSTGLGDGTYPVYAEVEEVEGWGKRIKKVWVEFISDDEIKEMKDYRDEIEKE